MDTMKAFVNKHRIKIESEYVDENPHMDSDHQMNHYKVKLTARIDGKRRQYTTYFSMGLGLRGDPEAADVLDCIASDSVSVENARDFKDWASELGYNDDSIKALKTYDTCWQQAERLAKFLGNEAYRDLLWETERL